MTPIQKVVSQIREQELIITNAKKRVEDLTDELRSLAPFRVGDRVKVISKNRKEEIGHVFKIEIYYDKTFRYTINKPKKDGTPSVVGRIWVNESQDKIELA